MSSRIELHLFDGKTGAHVKRLERASVTWADNINEAGSLGAKVRGGNELEGLMAPYRYIAAALILADGYVRVAHAGYLTHATRDRAKGIWDLDAGGGMTILDKRLVLNYALSTTWRDGTVLIDEDNPPGNWVLRLRGTYRDIVRGLIAETLKWGTLPITLPAVQGGSAHDITYNCWDLATVAERIEDIGDREDGPEFRLDPYLDGSWNLTFSLAVGNAEIVDHSWKWNVLAPNSQVTLGDEDRDGEDMCSACYAIGGKDDDKVLIAHHVGTALTGAGWPLMQVRNTQHNSVSVLSTLQSYARADVASGDSAQDSVELYAPMDKGVHVGDWADVRVGEGDADVLRLKVVGVKGGASSDSLRVECRERP